MTFNCYDRLIINNENLKVFKNNNDIIPVSIILLISLVDFTLYFSVDSIPLLALFWFLMIIPKGKICAWNHNHQHTMTFKSKPLNRFLEFFYALHTGVTSNLWVLHHVLGHHKNYLNQELDESRWKRKNGSKMGEWEYTWSVFSTAYYRGYQVGKRHPRAQKVFLQYSAITFAILLALLIYKPLPALFLFILPMISGLLLTSWATYEHHAGIDTDDHFEASYNNLNPIYNFFTGNLGYHTAHHYSQATHWSKLPDLHETIKDKIPEHLYRHNAL